MHWGEILSFSCVVCLFGPFAWKKMKSYTKHKALEVEENINESLELRDKAVQLFNQYRQKTKFKKQEYQKIKDKASEEIDALRREFDAFIKEKRDDKERELERRQAQITKTEEREMKALLLKRSFDLAETKLKDQADTLTFDQSIGEAETLFRKH